MSAASRARAHARVAETALRANRGPSSVTNDAHRPLISDRAIDASLAIDLRAHARARARPRVDSMSDAISRRILLSA